MKYLSVCSGIEAASVAWHDLGWTPEAFSEIEKFPSQVLAHHYPNVPNLGDMTKYKEWNLGHIDILVGGTPCQSFSVAGLRKGLEDPRGNLALTYVGILDKFRPKWFIWENVPGVLSSGNGRDFGSFLGAVAELGYGFAYRVLDAQHFGVPQRRKRVFVVGCIDGWQPAAEVLFESDCLRGNPKKGGTKRKDVAGYVESSFGQYREDSIGGTLKASGGVLSGGSETFVIPINDKATRFNGGGVTRNGDGSGNGLGIGKPGDPSPTLTRGDKHAVFHKMAVRKLMPIECERLQGFPDGYTDIRFGGKDTPDGPRYKALGNSMAVPCMKWLGERIAKQGKVVDLFGDLI